MDRRGFLPRLERLLLAADESAVGRAAARLAGLIAGAQGMPVTILKLEVDMRRAGAGKHAENASENAANSGHAELPDQTDGKSKEFSGAQSRVESQADLKTDPLAREVKLGAKKSADRVRADETEPEPEKVHLTARVPVDPLLEVVREDARKGYDLMFIGVDRSVEDGAFASEVTELAAGFEGPVIVFANGGEPLGRRSRILVPVNGNPQSRHAAEVALALARATGAQVQTLFVSQTDGHTRTRLREERVLKDMTDLGERYGVAVRTGISARSAAAGAILKEGARNYSMIVMGVSARPGEDLFFGNTAMAVLKGWHGAILMLAT
jgi:nucleotide-binding universal stress UspA family protein